MTNRILFDRSFWALSVICLTQAGCSSDRDPGGAAASTPPIPTPAPGVQLILGFDTSASWKPHLPASARIGARLSSHLDPNRDQLTAFRIDRSTWEFYDSRPPDGATACLRILWRELSKPPAVEGTWPATFYQRAVERSESSQQSVVVAFFTDGDNDNPAQVPHWRAAGAALAANPRVAAVAIYGVSASNWASVRSLLGPLGDRLLLYSESDMDPSVLMQRIDSLVHH